MSYPEWIEMFLRNYLFPTFMAAMLLLAIFSIFAGFCLAISAIYKGLRREPKGGAQ